MGGDHTSFVSEVILFVLKHIVVVRTCLQHPQCE